MDELLKHGGPVLWLQAALAFFAVVFVVERLLYFHGVRINAADFLRGIANHVRRKAFAEAMHEASRSPGPVARVAHSVLIRHQMDRSDLRDVAEEAVCLEVPRIEKNLRALLGIALLAPLAGMLGTVLGLIDVFMEVQEHGGLMTQAGMAGGIFESLVTTAAGLTIATGAYVFYLSMIGKGKRLLYRLERTGIEVVNLIADARSQTEIVSFRDEVEAREKATILEKRADSNKS
ncbi:MAG: MotA/TolQ/ExbB proton channel family protein [Akkermansiaceae bacterium]|nr:MotA/TolQ/ExbB proton channel family protein [Akkermansiaceae bacterium]|tara:strand:- start:125 stop:823 length:699 start_codon:yes stop_codon:yes gene_type:complete